MTAKVKEALGHWRSMLQWDCGKRDSETSSKVTGKGLIPNYGTGKEQLPEDASSLCLSSSISSDAVVEPRRWSQILSLLPVYLLQINWGMNSGYPAIITPQLSEPCSEFPITTDEESWIVNMDNVAMPVVCILSGYLQQSFGPLKVIAFACLPYSIGWILAAAATDVHYLYLSRIFVGVSNALLSATIYTVEIASKEMRGTYSVMESVVRCSGCLVVYSLGYVFRWNEIAIFASAVPLAAFVASVTLASESPVFLIANNKTQEAKKTLLKIYGPKFNVGEEIATIQAHLANRRNKYSPSLFNNVQQLKNNPEVYKPFFIVLLLVTLQQFSGASIIRAYVVKIFHEVFSSTAAPGSEIQKVVNCTTGEGVDSTSSKAYLSAIVIAFFRLLSTLLLSKLLRIYGRRSMYFLSAGCTLASLLGFATCVFLMRCRSQSEVATTALKWSSLCTACLLVISAQLGVQTLPMLLSGELFPSDVRAFCKGLTRSFACVLLFGMLKTYPVMEATLGTGESFYILAAGITVGIPFVYSVLPETKDMGLETIHSHFTSQKRPSFWPNEKAAGQSEAVKTELVRSD